MADLIYITGDTHGDFARFSLEKFPEQNIMTKDDYVIICGDFGGIWAGDEQQEKKLDSLSLLPFTILFADGNHENYDLLNDYPVMEWHGGQIQTIRHNVLHLMRGQIYEIDGKSFFVMGGAACHDLWNSVLDMEDSDFEAKYFRLRHKGEFFRIKGLSWWEQELPTDATLEQAWNNLCAHGKTVDYVISHCAPTTIQEKICRKLNNHTYKPDRLTQFHQRVYNECKFEKWFCGHYHHPMKVGRIQVLYKKVQALA